MVATCCTSCAMFKMKIWHCFNIILGLRKISITAIVYDKTIPSPTKTDTNFLSSVGTGTIPNCSVAKTTILFPIIRRHKTTAYTHTQ